MRRAVLAWVLGLGLFGAGQLFAQQPPEIRYTSVPDFLKFPPDIYLGEVAGVAVNSKAHVFVFSRANSTGPAYGALAHNFWSLMPAGNFCARLGTICMLGRLRTP